MIFLNIGDKIKLCRKKYRLKQTVFERYGVTQYYLSLIENNKRNPSDEMIESIYQALLELTNEKVVADYSLEEFKKSENEQVVDYLRNAFKKDRDNYADLIALAKQYNVEEVLFECYQRLGKEAQQNKNYIKSNEYFKEALHYKSNSNQAMLEVCKQLGYNLKMNMNYEGAIGYYTMALKFITHKEDGYRIKYHLGIIESQLGNHAKALNYAEENIEKSKSKQTMIASLILKEHVLRKMGAFETARQLLQDYLKSPLGDEFIDCIYYNLACNYSADEKYSEALKICFDLLDGVYPLTQPFKHKVTLLVGSIYKKTQQYEKGLIFLNQIKDSILQQREQLFIKWFYETLLDSLIALHRDHDIYQLMNEVKILENQNIIASEIVEQLQSKLIRYAIPTQKVTLFETILMNF